MILDSQKPERPGRKKPPCLYLPSYDSTVATGKGIWPRGKQTARQLPQEEQRESCWSKRGSSSPWPIALPLPHTACCCDTPDRTRWFNVYQSGVLLPPANLAVQSCAPAQRAQLGGVPQITETTPRSGWTQKDSAWESKPCPQPLFLQDSLSVSVSHTLYTPNVCV